MARNEEKAQAMLNRWYTMKRNLHAKPQDSRPSLYNEFTSLTDCEKWRQHLIRDISKKVSTIQNAGLGEHRIRDLNDEINRLIREKNHWEERIKDLGGPDYRKAGAKLYDSYGVELPGSGGYKYFGAAKDLPGVRELFQKDVPAPPSKNRGDLYRSINYEYYGLRENEDKEMLEEEREQESKARKEELRKWILANQGLVRRHFRNRNPEEITEEEIVKIVDENVEKFQEEHDTIDPLHSNYTQQKTEVISSQELEKRKTELLRKYVFMEEEEFVPRGDDPVAQLIKMNQNL